MVNRYSCPLHVGKFLEIWGLKLRKTEFGEGREFNSEVMPWSLPSVGAIFSW